jgi:UDPglucose--hexose-1-phosphate uridylyltransferase
VERKIAFQGTNQSEHRQVQLQLRWTMSQFRKDVFTGRWVIVAETEAVPPGEFRFKEFTRETTFCPFCETHEASTPPEIFAIRPDGSPANRPGWKVRVVPNSQSATKD